MNAIVVLCMLLVGSSITGCPAPSPGPQGPASDAGVGDAGSTSSGGGEGEGEGEPGGEGEGEPGGEGEGEGEGEPGGEGEGEGEPGGEGEGEGEGEPGGEGEGEGEPGGEGEGEGEGDSGNAGVICDDDADCTAGLVCSFDTSLGFLRAVCAAAQPGLAPGSFCDTDTECARGSCLDGLCSAPCDAADDCGNGLACITTSLTVGGVGGALDVCAFDTTQPPTVCHADSDCLGVSGQCNVLVSDGANNLSFVCGPPGDGAPFGASCASPYLQAPDTCETGVCDHDTAGTCTRLCTGDEDCGGNGFFCAGTGLLNVADRFCARACSREADCTSPGQACQLRDNLVENVNDLACTGESGPLDTGATATSSLECKSNLLFEQTINGVSSVFCSEFCVDDADCPVIKPRCISVDFPKPTSGTQRMRICAG